METVVLVTYATRYGSTEETALVVADALRTSGLAVESQPIRCVHSLERYCAVVLGAPLYMTKFHKDARRFLSANRAALMKIPIALFVPGPVQKDERDWTGARTQMEKELAKFPWLSPVAREIVGGRFDPTKLGFPFNLIPALRNKIPAGDVRDWVAIRAWAGNVASTLQPVLQR